MPCGRSAARSFSSMPGKLSWNRAIAAGRTACIQTGWALIATASPRGAPGTSAATLSVASLVTLLLRTEAVGERHPHLERLADIARLRRVARLRRALDCGLRALPSPALASTASHCQETLRPTIRLVRFTVMAWECAEHLRIQG